MAIGHDRLIRKLGATSALSPEEASAIRELPLKPRNFAAETEVLREGARPKECCVVVDGVFVRQKTTPEGRRQIMSFHIPGDFVDLHSIYLRVLDHSVAAVGPGTVAFVPHTEVQALLQGRPRIAQVLLREALVDASIHREWVINLGARSAYQRTAHLLCEYFLKMRAVGLTEGFRCAFPLTQRDLADCMGLSAVHVNRTLQQLRREELIVLCEKSLEILDLNALQAVGQFDPTYLHLGDQAA